MNDLVILVPTRARPQAVVPLAEAFAATCDDETWLTFCLDGDPDNAVAYQDAYRHVVKNVYGRTLLLQGPRRRLVGTLNHCASHLGTAFDPPFAVGFMGDDHLPATRAWDTKYLDALHALGTGIVYGDDEIQGANLPTQLAMTSDIIRAIGYMAPPSLTHLYCDNFWKDLGEGAGCLTYLPDVIVRHNHPGVGRAEWDASYRESNSVDQYATDITAYRDYTRDGLASDIEKVRKLRVDRAPVTS